MTEAKRPWSREDLAEVAALIADIDICMLVTKSEDGLRGRPMSNNRNVEYDGDSWFFASRDGLHVTDIEADPAVALAYMHTERGIWISIEGDATVSDERRAQACPLAGRARDLVPRRPGRRPGRPDQGPG